MSGASEKMQEYFYEIDNKIKICYEAASNARKKNYDPSNKVDIPLASNMAERVEGLISIAAAQIKNSGLSRRIEELEKEYGNQEWRIAFIIALEVAEEKFCKFKDKLEAMEVALRVGLSYLTNGVVSSPLEGFLKLELKKRIDGSGEYFCLHFGGPIRSAGTTATCVFVALCDYVRMKMGYLPYDATQDEINRTFAELEYYHERVTNLQYFPSKTEADFMTKNLPVQIAGDPSENIDVPNYRDLPRVDTNKIRNGFCLVFGEGLCQKAAKFWGKFSKWNREFGMEHWKFLEEFVKIQKELRARGRAKKSASSRVVPDYNYIKDLVAGRPVLGYPMSLGTFRARLGRARTTGLSDDAIHPASMVMLDGFVAYGTQLKTERPGKSTVISSCDSIEGPIVKLKNGDVIFVESEEEAKKIVKDAEEILFLGDILINYGYFLDRGHVLAPVGYCEEIWCLELEKNAGERREEFSDFIAHPEKKLGFHESYNLSREFKIPLHPRFTYHWNDISAEQLGILAEWLTFAAIKEEKIILPISNGDYKKKRILELIGVPHKNASGEYIVIENEWALAFRAALGFLDSAYDPEKIKREIKDDESIVQNLSRASGIEIRDKSGLYIGSRMGRPEKAKMRKMTGSPHSLFPVGTEGGRLRCFQSALEKGKVTAEFPIYFCNECKSETAYPMCHKCDGACSPAYFCRECDDRTGECAKRKHNPVSYKKIQLPVKEYFDSAFRKIGKKNYPELIKGVRGTSNKEHIPEHLAKGILRALNNIYVNKDGTTRYDMTEMSLTHFKPKEIGTGIKKLKELGYTNDVYGNELANEEQILELRCQDLVLPSCPESKDEGADYVLSRIANFVDDLLEYLYGMPRFYNLKSREDLVGHLVVGLSPHTAAGIVGRIIGFSKTQGMLANPLFHSFMRRDSDGDESCVMLLMDALLNFSPKLLSNHRGATQDEPLVLTSRILPAEVDDMVFNMDICWRYPLELYEACTNYKNPNEIKIKTLRSEIGEPGQYEGWGFTHDTNNLNNSVRCSVYKTLPTMQEKVEKQMFLCEKLRAVDAADVARLVVERHFLRDIKGNLRKFSQQEFRCVSCNEKFRRPPIKGMCLKCNGRIIFTINEGGITKYLNPCLSLAEKYALPPYLVQTLDLLKQRIEMVFGKEKDRQEALGKWFNS